MERQFKCVLDVRDKRITVNVFAPNKKNLEEKAINEAVRFMEELGEEVRKSEVKPVGYIDCGVWPPVY